MNPATWECFIDYRERYTSKNGPRFLVLVWWLLAAVSSLSADELVRSNLLLLPNSRDAIDQLYRPARMAGENVPFRQAVETLVRGSGLSVWIDRRIDAHKLISPDVPPAELEICLRKMATAAGVEFGLIENVIIFAPLGQVAAIEASAVRTHDLLSRSTERVTQRPIQWPILTESRELLSMIGSAWRVEIEGTLPHDLMDAGELQPCTLSTQLSLLVSGFELQIHVAESGTLQLKPLAKEPKWRGVYARGEVTPANSRRVLTEHPDAKFAVDRGQANVFGPTEVHRQLLARRLPQRNSKEESLTRRRIESFEGQGSILEVVNHLARHFGLDAQWNPAISDDEKQKIIKIQIGQPTGIDEAFAELENITGLSIKRTGSTLAISRK